MLSLLAVALVLSAADRPVPAADAAARMTAPPGFGVTLFAGEPDLVQPIAFTFDDRGRVWVVECVTYPKWLQPGQKGKDRVVVFEDTDHDGKHDTRTVVLDDGVNLSGIEWCAAGIYLCSTPNLVFVPIQDDKPSGPPKVLLDGWNLKDAKHNVFNGLSWGPDGWLYGCNGIQTKSRVGKPGTPDKDRTYLDCGVWRYHPGSEQFDVVAVGMTNPWGVDWDDRGEMFATNCVIDHLWHLTPGGRYQRMHGQDSNPYSFAAMPSAVDYRHWAGGHWTDSRADKKTGALSQAHADAGGGHAHSGTAIYLGENFPPEYRDTLFTCNIHGARLNNDGLARTRSGMKGVRRPDFLFANDPWFRGVAVKQGPEGALYVADWTDTGECHNYDVADISNGRLFRVAFGKPVPPLRSVAEMSLDELFAAHTSKNEWLVRHARRRFLELLPDNLRRAAMLNALRAAAVSENGAFDVPTRLRFLQTFFAAVEPDDDTANAAGLLDLKDETLRAAAVTLLARHAKPLPGRDPAIRRLAQGEPSPRVRRAIAGALQKCLPGTRMAAAELARYPEDDADPDLVQMIWLAFQPVAVADPPAGLALMKRMKLRKLRENVVRAVVGSDPARWLDPTVESLAGFDTPTKEDALRGMLAALADRTRVSPPPSWAAAYEQLSAHASPAVRDLADAAALKFGDPRAVERLTKLVAQPAADAAERVTAIERLAPLKPAGFADLLTKQLSDAATRGAAVRALAVYPDAAGAVLTAYPKFTPAEKADAVQTLSVRPTSALLLLAAVETGTVPKGEISAFAARQMLTLNDKPVAEKLAAVWGTVKPASANRAEQTAKLKKRLTNDYVTAGDVKAGKALYAKQCGACHVLFGEGGNVGPELTGSQRANLDYVLENVLDPNAVVPFDYTMTAFTLADGRTLTGLVKAETPQAVTVRTVNELVVIPVADIETRKPTQNSLMPEGLFDTLKETELRDLIAYLRAKEPVR